MTGSSADKGLDNLDRRIINEMSESSQGSYRQIAKRLGIHPTTLIQRVKSLEERGIIKGYRATLDLQKVGFEFMAMVHMDVEGDLIEVQSVIKGMPSVVAVYDVTGEWDSITMLACNSRDELSRAVKQLLQVPGVKKTNTYMILNVIKDPFDFLPNLPVDEE